MTIACLLASGGLSRAEPPGLPIAYEPRRPPPSLRIADDQPPPPPPVEPDKPEVPWTSGSGSMPWTPAVSFGPSYIVTKDFATGGFDIGVGFRHFQPYNPNPTTHNRAAGVASLGLLALPKGALLGNDLGLDLVSRLYFISAEENLIETAIRPVLRVTTAKSELSFPSVLGTLLPAVGVTALSAEEGEPHHALLHDYDAFLLRWSFDARLVLSDAPVQVFLEAVPSAEVLVPFDGRATHATFSASLNFGCTPMER